MNEPSTMHDRAPQTWTAMAFFTAGLLFAVFAIFWIAATLGAPEFPTLSGVFGAAGWMAAFLGLLGLHSTVSQRSPTLARSGAVLAVVGLLAAAALIVGFTQAGMEPAAVGAAIVSSGHAIVLLSTGLLLQSNARQSTMEGADHARTQG